MLCQKKKTQIEILKLNVRVLDTLSRAKYECLASEKKKKINKDFYKGIC